MALLEREKLTIAGYYFTTVKQKPPETSWLSLSKWKQKWMYILCNKLVLLFLLKQIF